MLSIRNLSDPMKRLRRLVKAEHLSRRAVLVNNDFCAIKCKGAKSCRRHIGFFRHVALLRLQLVPERIPRVLIRNDQIHVLVAEPRATERLVHAAKREARGHRCDVAVGTLRVGAVAHAEIGASQGAYNRVNGAVVDPLLYCAFRALLRAWTISSLVLESRALNPVIKRAVPLR